MIIFEKLRYKNFLSTGNAWTEIDFLSHSKTLIRGKNGAGKSTMLDALTFVLFNKPFRKINKPQLISSINQKDMLVELEFSVNQVSYKIVRGMKPNIFEIYQEGVLINQDSENKDYQQSLEQSILKMNLKSFAQIVVLGSASFVPFMQLPTPQRREVIEDLLDIQVFSVMNAILKKKMDENKEAIKDIKYKIDLLEQRIESSNQYNETIRTRNEDEILNLNKKIEKYNEDIEHTLEIISDMMEQVEVLLEKIKSIGVKPNKLNQLQQVKQTLKNKIKSLQKDIDFYGENDNCPTCLQSIESTFKAEEIQTRQSKIDEISSNFDRLDKEIIETQEALTNVSNLQEKVNKLNLDIAKENASISIWRKSLTQTSKELETALSRQTTSDFIDIETLYKDLGELHAIQNSHFEDRDVYTVGASLLKDGGIKSAIIKQYIPVINSLVNKYLEKLDFFVNFELDENFSETIKSRHRDVFSYASFSEGEKAKIDLALLMTWREVSRLRSSMSTNLLIMDEVFDGSLDFEGTDLLMQIFETLGENTNIFVISHKNDQLNEKFDRIIQFEKYKGFSIISKNE